MKRPLVLAALTVLSGILCGIQETPLLVKTAALTAMAALITCPVFGMSPEGRMPGYDKAACERKPYSIAVITVLILFILGFLRASFVSASYSTPEARAFFARYEATNPGQFDYAMYLKGQGICNEEAYQAFRPNPEIKEDESGFLGNTRCKRI